MIKLYNTQTKKKEILKPLKTKRINLFVCGPTVYDYSHIGHARTYIAFDAFVKYLKQIGLDVFYLQNITNIDDKIIKRAKEQKTSPEKLAKFFEKEYLKDMKELKIDSVTKYAKATDYIKEIIQQIKQLIDKGYAYKIEDGIYYDISKFKNYGKLSKRTITQAQDAVSRIDETKNKKNKGDFCLWKFHKDDDPKWKSPFGDGRPGWHIEDTAITEKIFGYQYDIHGGSRDLIFPHHEAEIAQIEAISGKSPMVNIWMHTGFLTINGQKMSKSLGNFITIQDFLKKYPAKYLRFLILKTLWHSPIDYSEKSIIDAKNSLEKIEEFLRKIKAIIISNQSNKEFENIIQKSEKDFYLYLDDDFNTPKALAVIFNFIRKINKLIDKNLINKKQAKKIKEFLRKINEIFGIIDFKKIGKLEISKQIKELIKKREIFRKEKNWQKSDNIRKEIIKLGYKIKDTDKGTIITKK
ncbi:MAG: cysteine--tRNA ligase [Candidatus Nealsonbacteria bacterium]